MREEIYETAYILKFALTSGSQIGQRLLEEKIITFPLNVLIDLVVRTEDVELGNLLGKYIADEISKRIQARRAGSSMTSSSVDDSSKSTSDAKFDSEKSAEASSNSPSSSQRSRSRRGQSSNTTRRRKKKNE